MAVHEFQESLARGLRAEVAQDALHTRWFIITKPSVSEDRRGIDRYFEARTYPLFFTVQYKGCEQIAKTGNFAIEVVSNDVTMTPGWALKCNAAVFSYFDTANEIAYWLDVDRLRSLVPVWLTQGFKTHRAPNPGYKSLCYMVPMSVVMKSACYLGTASATGSYECPN